MPRSFLIQKKRAGRRARGGENAVMQNVETGEKDATTTTYLPDDTERVPLPAKRVLLPVLNSTPESSSPTAVNPLREPGHYTDMEQIDKRYEGYTYNPYARFAPYFNAHHPLFGYAYMGLPLIDLSNPSHLSHLSHLSHPSHPSHIYQYAPKLDHSSPANRYHPYHRHSNSPDREVEAKKTTGNDVITGRSSPASALSPVESGLDRNDNLSSAPGVFRQTRYGSHETLQSSSADDSGYKTSYSPISSASSSPVIPDMTTDTTERESPDDVIDARYKENIMKDVTKDSDRMNVMGEVCAESDVDVDSDEDVDPVREDYIDEECSYDCKGHVKEQVNDEFVIKEAEIQTDFEIQQRLGSNVRKTLFEGDTTADRKDEYAKENHYQSPASVSPSVQDSKRWRKGHIENILKPSDPVSEKPALRDHHFWVNNVPNFSRGVYAGGKDMKAPLSPYPLYPVGSVTRPVAVTSPGYGHTTGEVPHPHGAGISGVEERGYGIRESSEGPVYVCRECGKSYSTYSGLAKHKQFHCASVLKKEFSCKHCTKTYTSLGALKMHIRTHTLPCKCQLCGKAFSRPWLLQGHIRTHTGEKPFSCPHCQRSFADRSNLRAHLQTHSDIKKYSCKACAKTFSRMSLLLKHEDGGCAAVP